MALAAETTTITKNVNNTSVNVQTDTHQKQDCQTVAGTSGIAKSCEATSTDIGYSKCWHTKEITAKIYPLPHLLVLHFELVY